MTRIDSATPYKNSVDAKILASRPSTNATAGVHASNPAIETERVSISGEALVLSRLFGSAEAANAPVETELNDRSQISGRYAFLTREDRAVLANLYEAAQDQGVDLLYVDNLAADLGDYRKLSKVASSFNSGVMFDTSGRLQTVSFTEKDKSTAARILASPSLGTTALDAGFIQRELDPGYSANHLADFDFLEWSINATSSKPDQQFSSDKNFATYVSNGRSNFVMHTALEVTLPQIEPDISVYDGKITITETGFANGFTMENGMPVQKSKVGAYAQSVLLDLEGRGSALLQTQSDNPNWLLDWLDQWKETTERRSPMDHPGASKANSR